MMIICGTRRILVVDDEPLIREALSARLNRSGFEVATAASADEAWERILRDPPDAIVLDICMPGVSGFELLDRLRSDERTRLLPVVLLSALSDTEHVVHGLQRGATDYVVKPPSIPLLVARLNAEIERSGHLKSAEEQLRTMAHLAQHDDLTHLYNRRALNESLEFEFRRMSRYDRPLSLLMVDLDGFKEVNDTHGHGVGDEVLQQLAVRLTASLRATDIVGRFGGEEFCILLPETGLEAAARAAENVRQAVESTAFETSAGPLHLTISLGLTAGPQDDLSEPADLVRQADEALYEAKNSGRNRVCLRRADPARAGRAFDV